MTARNLLLTGFLTFGAACAAPTEDAEPGTAQAVTVRPTSMGASLRFEGPALVAPDTFVESSVTLRLENNQEVQVPLGQDTPLKAGRVCLLNVEHEGAEPPCITLESGRTSVVGLGAMVLRAPAEHEHVGPLKTNQAKLAYPGTLSKRLWLAGPTHVIPVEARKLAQVVLDAQHLPEAYVLNLDVEESRFADGCAMSLVASTAQAQDAVFVSDGAKARRRLVLDLMPQGATPTTLKLQGQANYAKGIAAPGNGTLKLTRIDVDAPAGVSTAKYEILERSAQGAKTVCAAPTQTGMFVLPGTYEVRTTWKDSAGVDQLSVSVVTAP
jgi:hypothetical protein